MNFIYDIILNFNDELYESFEWEIGDSLLHVKKIPIFRIQKKEYYNIKNNKVVFDKDFLQKIFKQNNVYKSSRVNGEQYISLIAFEEEVIAIKLNNKGEIIQKSHLLIDEERSVLKVVHRLEIDSLNYKILNSDNDHPYLTRKEKEDIRKIVNKITELYKNKEQNKLEYLYLECFGKQEKNIDIIFEKLKTEVIKTSETFNKIIDFFELIKQK